MSETVASAMFVDNSISCHIYHTVSVFQSAPLNAVEIFEYCYLSSGVSKAFFHLTSRRKHLLSSAKAEYIK